MGLRNWPNMNPTLLEALGSKEFRLYTLPYPPVALAYFRIRCFIWSGGPSRSRLCMNICNNAWQTLSMAPELRVSFVGSGRREKTYRRPCIDDSTPYIPGTRSWNTVVNRDV